MIRRLLLPEAVDIQGRTNVCMTGPREELVAHYLEAEFVEICGASRGARGWPTRDRLAQVRGGSKA